MPATRKKEIKVHNSVELDTSLPQSFDVGSNYYTSTGGFRYIPYPAPKDDWFKKFLTLRLLSPTLASCISDKTFYATGDGLQVEGQEFPKQFDKKINSRRQLLDTILKLAFDGYWQDGNKFLEVVRTTAGSTKLVHVYEHSSLDCRFEEAENGYDPTHVLRTREFRRHGILTDLDKAIRIPLWTDMPEPGQSVWAPDARNRNVERTMFHIKNIFSGIDGYGLPTNFAGQDQVTLEIKAARFNIDNFNNNMFLGGILFFQGSLSEPEEKKILKNIKKMFASGEGTFNRILTLSSQEGMSDVKFVPFNYQQDGHFLEMDKRVEEKIIGANQWSKELMDLKNQSGLGKGGDYLVKLFKAKYHTIIRPVQEMMMNDFVWPLMSIIDDHTGSKFYDLPWHIKPAVPIAFEGALDVNALLTVNEGRDEIGKEPLADKEKGEKLLAEVTKGSAPAANPDEQKEKGGEDDRP